MSYARVTADGGVDVGTGGAAKIAADVAGRVAADHDGRVSGHGAGEDQDDDDGCSLHRGDFGNDLSATTLEAFIAAKRIFAIPAGSIHIPGKLEESNGLIAFVVLFK